MSLKRRYLRPIKFGKRSKEFYVFDVETAIAPKDGNGDIEYILSARPEHLLFGCIVGPKGYRKLLWSADAFKQEFKKRRYKNKIVYAHNAEYDLSAVFGNIYHADPAAIFNGKFISCTINNTRFGDSYNLLPTSVKKLGSLIGLEKQELGKNLRSNIKTIQKDIDYCFRDCDIVYKSLEKLFADAEPSFTIGSLSLKIYRANFLKETFKVNTLSDHFFDALYGGRTEAFKIGDVDANVYDRNSAYPCALKTLRFPDPARLRYAPNKEWQKYVLYEMMWCHDPNQPGQYATFTYEGMIDATVCIPESVNIPCLPYRTDTKLLFPVGTFRGSWTLNEFRYAYCHGLIAVKKVHRLIISESIPTPFDKYIDYYYTLRTKTNDKFEKYYYKLFMNNLYGKLIQRAREEWRFCKDLDEAKEFMRSRKLKHVELVDVNGGLFLKYDVDKIFSHTVACWGAYVTADARIALHKRIMQHPDKVVYCDTDSEFVEADFNEDSDQLGGWKKENKKIVKIRALKDYVAIEENPETNELETKQYLKGVKKDAKQLDPEANVFKIKRMIKTRESFRRVDNLPPGTFIEQIKVMTGDYSKRTILKDGSTKPFKLTL